MGFFDNIQCRYIMTFLSFFGFVFNYMLRININITIVAMVNYSSIAKSNDSGRGAECGIFEEEESHDADGPYAWNENTQSLITSSFFWGYVLLQIPGGRLAEVIGGKWIFGCSIIFTGILNIIFPFAAAQNPAALVALRILMGVCEGPTFPGMHAMLAKWAPPEERYNRVWGFYNKFISRIASIVYAGCQAGTMLGYPLSSYITDALGWEYVFYIIGGSSLVWGAAWIYFVFDSPQDHPRISQEELKFLSERMGHVHNHALPIPYKAILTSMPFWAILIADIGNNWGFWMLLTELPIYMKNILNYDLKKNGILSAAPYFAMWMFSMIFGTFMDFLLKRKVLNIKNIRKIATLTAHFIGAILLVGVSFTGCDDTMTLILLVAAVGFQGAIYTGFLTNHIDIAPNFAGTLYGVTNAVASIPSFVAPQTAALMTNGAQTLSNWRKVFFISAAFYAGGSVFFAIFADGEVQDWNDENYMKKSSIVETGDDKKRKTEVEKM